MFRRINQDFEDAQKLLDRYQRWDDATTADIQLRALAGVWQDCTTDIPYYKSLVQSGSAPSIIRSWDDFRQIPELNREILQNRPDEFRRLSGPPDLIRMTGGSTGNPIRFGVGYEEDRTIRLLKLTLWIRAGYKPKDRLFLIWGHPHLLGTGYRRHVRQLQRKLKDRWLGYRRVDAFVLDADRCRQYANQLLRHRPAGLIGYAAALDLFVRSNPELAARFCELGLRFVMPCAEPPPKPDTFDLFRSTFGCPVVQEFGGVDFGHVASQYDREPFMVFPDKNILELDKAPANEEGAGVLVTTLYRRYLPLIRYRQGDAISGHVLDQHGHVRSFNKLAGRSNDMVVMPDGRSIHSVAFFHCVHPESEVLNVQMILEDSGLRLVFVTQQDSLTPEVEQRIRHRFSQLHEQLAQAPIECRKDVETTRAGKRRWIVDKRTAS